MLEKISAYTKVLEKQATLYASSGVSNLDSNEFYYSVLYSTNVNECFDKENYIAIHYALKKSFTVKFLKTEEKNTIKENTFFIAKSSVNYKLLQNEETICCVISILIDRHYFMRELLTLIDQNHALALFFNDGECLYANPDLSEVAIIEKEYFHKLLDTIPLQNLSSQATYKEYMNLILKRIILFIDYHFTANIFDSLSLKTKIILYINENLQTGNLADLASRLDYSKPYLSQKIYALTGKNFSLLLREERMKMAKRLLEESKYPLKQISKIVGYENDCSFVTAFKETYDVSPIAYRNNLNDKE